MSAVVPDESAAATAAVTSPRTAAGVGFALVAGISFGSAGALGRGLIDAGWTPASAVTVRILGGFAVILIPAILTMGGRWSLLRRNVRLIAGFGVLGVATAQVCYFYAVTHMSVGVALMIEYLAPVAVIGWLWLRQGQRPSRVTTVGAAVAIAGLALVLDLLSGASISLVGVAWALGAMLGAATYFLLAAEQHVDGLPPITLAAAGLLVGGLALLVCGALGLLPFTGATTHAEYADLSMPWWLPLLLLAVVTAAVPYVSGVLAVRRIGSRLTSFVMLTEVLAALVFAWLLLAEVPNPIQLVGGLVMLAGVAMVKIGERETLEQ